ncbi:MAG: hypothetical protein K2O09_04835 [Treponemataceae bacterium]|nr:hypothetical protein [Treponemataceae bacterium]
MKSIKKYLFIMAALAAVFGFVACNDEDDDPSTVATYKDATGIETVTFLDDNTWSVSGEVLGNKMTVAEGTYTGDPAKDGDITITMKKAMGADGKMKDIPNASAEKVTISNGKMTYDYTLYTRQ